MNSVSNLIRLKDLVFEIKNMKIAKNERGLKSVRDFNNTINEEDRSCAIEKDTVKLLRIRGRR